MSILLIIILILLLIGGMPQLTMHSYGYAPVSIIGVILIISIILILMGRI
jgi:hypothetical protein